MASLLRVALLVLVSLPISALGQAKEPGPGKAFPGKKWIEGYFQQQVKDIQSRELTEFTTKEAWEKAKPQKRQQLLEMLGLWPLPARTDLKATVTGTVDMPKYTIEKIHFQSRPGLYVTANIYIPKPAPKNAPTILYVCGHGNNVKDGVSYGSKTYYQHHAAWFAENGYVCFIIDTLQLSEIPGLHHGTYREKMWWWHALGYTPAGVECWNAMRSLDYLETRPEVDAKRIGVAGRSGGGAYSWWITATDERIACAVPVAGIADLQAHLNEGYPGRLEKGVIAGHCDCMFMVNTYRFDFSTVIALCAPRPVLLGNTDNDEIFPVQGYRRIASKAAKIYELYGAKEKFDLLEMKGKHEDTLELRQGEFLWMNRWLKNDRQPIAEAKLTLNDVKMLKVLTATPNDEINTKIQESFIKPASIVLPKSQEVVKTWWPEQKAVFEKALQEQVFRNWSKDLTGFTIERVGEKVHDGIKLEAWDFSVEKGLKLRLWVMSAPGVAKQNLLVLNCLDREGWQEWCADLGPEFKELLQQANISKNEAKFKQNKQTMEKFGWSFAAICPRGVGPTEWADPGTADDIQIRRRLALIGQSLDGQRVWDLRRAIDVIGKTDELKKRTLWLQGNNDMAGICLYAGMNQESVKRMDLWDLPSSHRDGPHFLNILRHFDMPQGLGMALEQKVILYEKSAEAAKRWAWVMELQETLGKKNLTIRVVGK